MSSNLEKLKELERLVEASDDTGDLTPAVSDELLQRLESTLRQLQPLLPDLQNSLDQTLQQRSDGYRRAEQLCCTMSQALRTEEEQNQRLQAELDAARAERDEQLQQRMAQLRRLQRKVSLLEERLGVQFSRSAASKLQGLVRDTDGSVVPFSFDREDPLAVCDHIWGLVHLNDEWKELISN